MLPLVRTLLNGHATLPELIPATEHIRKHVGGMSPRLSHRCEETIPVWIGFCEPCRVLLFFVPSPCIHSGIASRPRPRFLSSSSEIVTQFGPHLSLKAQRMPAVSQVLRSSPARSSTQGRKCSTAWRGRMMRPSLLVSLAVSCLLNSHWHRTGPVPYSNPPSPGTHM